MGCACGPLIERQSRHALFRLTGEEDAAQTLIADECEVGRINKRTDVPCRFERLLPMPSAPWHWAQ